MKKTLLTVLIILGLSYSTQSMADVKNLPIICQYPFSTSSESTAWKNLSKDKRKLYSPYGDDLNIYVDKLAPWNLKKTNTVRMNEVLSVLVEIIRRSSIMLFPIIPDSIKKIYQILNLDEKQISFNYYDNLPKENHTINLSIPIFPRIDT